MIDIPVAPWERSGALRLFCGVDLGAKGALSVIDPVAVRVMCVLPMPAVKTKVGKTDRSRLDYEGLARMLDYLEGMGVELFIAENPGAGYGAGGRQLGEQVGAFKAFVHEKRLRVEWVTPGQWKKALKVPADKREAILRAEAIFPHDREKFKGSRGGQSDGKAEASMIGLFGGQRAL